MGQTNKSLLGTVPNTPPIDEGTLMCIESRPTTIAGTALSSSASVAEASSISLLAVKKLWEAWKPLGALDVALRDLYKAAALENSTLARALIKDLGGAGAVDEAAAAAGLASDLRNLLRATTQARTTPVGKVIQSILDQKRDWAFIVEKYGDPFDTALSAERRLEIADTIAAASGRSRAVMNGVQTLGKVLLVLGVLQSAWKALEGIGKMQDGDLAEGSIDLAEGTINMGMSGGTYVGVKVGLLTAEAGMAASLLTMFAGLAAGGSVTLAAETARAAAAGEKTPLEVADDYYGTQFSDIYAWQKRSTAARIGFAVVSLGGSEAWYLLNQWVER